MAARKKLSHDDKTREKIKTTQLINRLQDHVLKETELANTRIKAIEILLRKTLPDLKQLEVSGVVASMTHEQWLNTLKDE